MGWIGLTADVTMQEGLWIELAPVLSVLWPWPRTTFPSSSGL